MVFTFCLQNLTGGINGGVHITDVTNASRTMLMNIHSLKWDKALIEYVCFVVVIGLDRQISDILFQYYVGTIMLTTVTIL